VHVLAIAFATASPEQLRDVFGKDQMEDNRTVLRICPLLKTTAWSTYVDSKRVSINSRLVGVVIGSARALSSSKREFLVLTAPDANGQIRLLRSVRGKLDE